MMLLDSNIIIYSAQPENEFLRRLIAEEAPAVSAVSYVEVLGFHRLAEAERRYFGAFFAEARVLPLAQPVLDEAIRLRQARKIKLGDSLVAGTALLHGLTLVTRNVDDFTGIDGLRVLNPFAGLSGQ
ncbi:MAG TPA: type II toxin-antitoxin system VapC family toxin [Thermoanaerobaculia bacterium]|nr:type II toxin-antitoxin system VapC family toxin [Thermoanaerobaculia bacterium]